MAELSTVARPYARAAFEHARDHQALDGWSEWLDKLGQAVAVRDVQKLLSSPRFSPERKVAMLIELTEVKLDDSAKAFVEMLSEKGRLTALPAIAERFAYLRAEHDQRIEVTVVSAYALDDKQQNKLAGALKKRLNREISIITQVDPKLIGGVVLRAGDTVIDGSVRGRLNRLSEALTA